MYENGVCHIPRAGRTHGWPWPWMCPYTLVAMTTPPPPPKPVVALQTTTSCKDTGMKTSLDPPHWFLVANFFCTWQFDWLTDGFIPPGSDCIEHTAVLTGRLYPEWLDLCVLVIFTRTSVCRSTIIARKFVAWKQKREQKAWSGFSMSIEISPNLFCPKYVMK